MLNTFIFAVAAIVSINEKTGGFSAFGHSFENRYFLMEKGKPDVTAVEREDVVEETTKKDGLTVFVCSNPKMPGVKVFKKYVVDNSRKSVRRTLEFNNLAEKSKYVTLYVDCIFSKGFKKNLWHFGAGYIGPSRSTTPTPPYAGAFPNSLFVCSPLIYNMTSAILSSLLSHL
jgi:hypothetical protein